MEFIKVLAKTYGNDLLTTQALTVAATIKKDENTVVSLGKLVLVDQLMDTATWLMKPEDKSFWRFFTLFFITPIVDLIKILWFLISFTFKLLFYRILFKIIAWFFKLV